MTKLKEASLTKGLTISIAKFEFVKIDFSLTMTGDDIEELKQQLGKEVDSGLQAEVDKTLSDLHIDHIKVRVAASPKRKNRIRRK